MKNKIRLSNKVILILLFSCGSILAGHSQSLENLEEINTVWAKFYQAFDSLDSKLMAEIHSKKLVRISGGQRIRDYQSCIDNYKKSFMQARENGISNTIQLRFFERINNDSVASERGVYKLTRIDDKEKPQTYFGQFHVLLFKEEGQWKIAMDYDSSEGNSIDEEDYLKAHAIDKLEVFIPE